jgi:hypothetical protein
MVLCVVHHGCKASRSAGKPAELALSMVKEGQVHADIAAAPQYRSSHHPLHSLPSCPATCCQVAGVTPKWAVGAATL